MAIVIADNNSNMDNSESDISGTPKIEIVGYIPHIAELNSSLAGMTKSPVQALSNRHFYEKANQEMSFPSMVKSERGHINSSQFVMVEEKNLSSFNSPEDSYLDEVTAL